MLFVKLDPQDAGFQFLLRSYISSITPLDPLYTHRMHQGLLYPAGNTRDAECDAR